MALDSRKTLGVAEIIIYKCMFYFLKNIIYLLGPQKKKILPFVGIFIVFFLYLGMCILFLSSNGKILHVK